MYQYEKSQKAQLHEKSFSWFEGIGGAGRPVDVCSARTEVERRLPQQAKKAFVRTNALLAN